MSNTFFTTACLLAAFFLAALVSHAEEPGTKVVAPDALLDKVLEDRLAQMSEGATDLLEAVDEAAGDGSFTIVEEKERKPDPDSGKLETPSPSVVDFTKTKMMVAAEHHTKAQRLLKEARAAKTPEVRRKKLRQAKKTVEDATASLHDALDRARNIPGIDLGKLDAPHAGKKMKRIAPDRSRTYEYLQRIQKENEIGGLEIPRGLQLYDSTQIRQGFKQDLKPKRDPTLKGTIVPSPLSGTGETTPPKPRVRGGNENQVILSNDVSLDVSELRDAVAKVNPNLRAKPLFQTGPNGEILGLSLDVLRLVAAPEQWAKLAQIGGVSLEATFDVLDIAGVFELDPSAGLSLIEKPILLSLKTLYGDVAGYAKSGWDELPDSLRHPGGIERVKGFTLDPASGDVILIGEPAHTPEARIDIDEIILSLRNSWRDDRVMAVSLDPKLQDFSGPQYPLIINVPRDSIVAKIMIEADYAMKKIVMASGFAKGQRLVDMDAILRRVPPRTMRPSRFWLSPRPLGRGGAQLTADGRTLLVDLRVQAQTEQLFLTQQGGVSGAGRSGKTEQLAAETFTRRYDVVERAPHVRPPSVYMRLHGLMDLIAVAKFLRGFNVDAPILSKFASLPYRPLGPGERIPSYYPAVTGVFELSNSVIQYTGGVNMSLHAGSDQFDHVGNGPSERLSGAVSALGSHDRSHLRAGVTLAIARPEAEARADLQGILLKGQRALSAGNYEQAETFFRKVINAESDNLEALLGYSKAQIGRGNFGLAVAALRHAMATAPDDDRVVLSAMDLAWRHDARSAFKHMQDRDELRRQLSQHYRRQAIKAVEREDIKTARTLSTWAVQIWEDDGDAHIVRLNTRPVSESRRRQRDLVRAIRAYRKQIKNGETQAERRLALALSADAWLRGDRAGMRLQRLFKDTRLDGEVDISAIVTDLDAGIRAAREAFRLDDGLADALAAEASLGSLKAALDDDAAGLQKSLAVAERAVQAFPDHPMSYIARGNVHTLIGNMQSARADYDRAVAMAPASPKAYFPRAGVRAALGDCAGARRDVKAAKRYAPQGYPFPEGDICATR